MIEIRPVSKISASISVPASKSYTNRAYIIASLAEGLVRLKHPLISDDTRFMKTALEQFGIDISESQDEIIVHGMGGQLQAPTKEIFVGNAGTTMRFLTTLATLAPGITRLTGNERMQERPIEDLLDCLKQLKVEAKSIKNNQCPPLEINGGQPLGGAIQLAGNKSSQYLTSLLMCAPYFQNPTTIKIIGELTSKPYVDITLDIMKTFGINVENESYRAFKIPVGNKYKPQTYSVEGDASSASYFFGAAAITGGEVSVTNLNPKSAQGDIGFPSVLKQMGCDVSVSSEKITVRGKPLKGITINMNSMPDVVQTLAVVSLFAEGKTTITHIGNLRIKETDRIEALSKELTRLGAQVETGEDYLVIQPGPLKGTNIITYDDHRMAMSFSLVGLKLPGVRILNPKCVEKSFPGFFEELEKLYE